jgi:hypothetical protein
MKNAVSIITIAVVIVLRSCANPRASGLIHYKVYTAGNY